MMTRDDYAERFLEARRYVRTNPDAVKAILFPNDGTCMLARDISDRLLDNILLGLKYIQVDPEVLENYLYNAAFELRLKG